MASRQRSKKSDVATVEEILQRTSSSNSTTEVERTELQQALELAEHHVQNVARERQRWKFIRGRLLLAMVSDDRDDLSLVKAVEQARTALADLRIEPESPHTLKGMLTLGRLLMLRGQMDEALQFFVEATPHAERLGDAGALGVVQGNVATIQFQMRHFDEAKTWFQRAVDSFVSSSNPKSHAFALRGIGMCYSKLNEFEQALECYQQARILLLDVPEATKEYLAIVESTGIDLLNLRDKTGKAKYFTMAVEAFKECLSIAESEGLLIMRAVALRNLAMTYAEPQCPEFSLEVAQEYYRQALTLIRQAGAQLVESQILRDLASVQESSGDFEAALTTFRAFYDLERQLLNKETEDRIKALELKLATERQETEAARAREREAQLSQQLLEQRHQVTATSLSIGEKNAALRAARVELRKASEGAPAPIRSKLQRVVQQLEMAADADGYWDELEAQLMLVHHDVLEYLSEHHPLLTATERRVCAMILHELSTKDIARLLSIEPRSVEKYRQRIRKKLGRQQAESLLTFLSSERR
jgi:tetratricopeptide (TPR) repeat protein